MDLKKTHILIVDDTPHHILALEAILNELGQEIIKANTPEQALKYVLAYDFAVILLDVHMPNMNGFEVARLIRSRKKSSYTPIIFLSAISKDDKNINEGYAMGAVDYVFKPIDSVILKSKVKVFVDLYTKSFFAVNLQNELRLRKLAEEKTLKQQKLLELTELNRVMVMEELTSAMAHEVNQPLTAINIYIQGCIRQLKEKTFKKTNLIEILENVTKQVDRAATILHRTKNLLRKKNIAYENIEINSLLSDMLPFLSKIMMDFKINLKLKLCKSLMPQLSIDRIQFEQVLLNLLLNSIDALKSHHQARKQIIIQTELEHEENVLINIKDNGPGILDNFIPKIFDLYFTTKSTGMGLGLGICRTIIESHGGNIVASNNSDGGACFQIRLPQQKTKML